MDLAKAVEWVPEGVVNDLKLAVRDAEDLLQGAGSRIDEGYQAARARIDSSLDNVRSGITTLTTSGREAVESADAYVQEYPWQAVGIGALAGLAIGLWLGRK